jgi:SAM-dependent methyltransferase
MMITDARSPDLAAHADSHPENVRGTRQETDALRGTTLLQSPEEWSARNEELAASLNKLLLKFSQLKTARALDVGCMAGELTDEYGAGLPFQWFGIDPDIDVERVSNKGSILRRGSGDALPFPDNHFDCVTFANVYEHVSPHLRDATIAEIFRVLAPGGILLGQLPNPYFPLESHSRLPFLGCLPRALQRLYWRLTPTGWDFENAHFFSVTVSDLRRRASASGFKPLVIRDFNYSPRAIPKRLRALALVHSYLGVMPWSWQFVFQKPN